MKRRRGGYPSPEPKGPLHLPKVPAGPAPGAAMPDQLTQLYAAMIHKGDLVRINGEDVRVLRVHYSDPAPGKIRWELATVDGKPRRDLGVSARLRVELIEGAAK